MAEKGRVAIVSLGCSKNQVDSEVMGWRLKEAGYRLVSDPEEGDIAIVNTCGFINPAKEESIETILELVELKKEGKLKKVGVVGCLSERYREELIKEIPEVDFWAGVGEFGIIDQILERGEKAHFSGKTFLIGREGRVIFNSPFHAYIKLSEGCNQKCAFCAIPNFKGKLVSRPIPQILEEVERLTEQGYRDFSLIAQDSSSYLWDRGEREGLIKLIKELDRFKGATFRIQYLYPNTTSIPLLEAILESPVVESYFDLPLQHISPTVLKKMKRDIPRRKLEELIKFITSYGHFRRTTLLVGHPGEGEEEFRQLKEFVAEGLFDRIALFQYSDEEGTTAYNYPPSEKVPPEVAARRIEELGELIQKVEQERLDRLVGRQVVGYLEGLSPDQLFYLARPTFWSPEIDGEILINDLSPELEKVEVGGKYRIEITQRAGGELLGTLLPL